jgi:NRPS condensation-like uncharacterized protein
MPDPYLPTVYPAPLGDRLVCMMRRIGDMQVHAVAELEAPLEFCRLQKAVRLAMDAEPVLGCRYVNVPTAPYWRRRDDLDDLEHSQMVETTGTKSTSDPNALPALRRFLATPSDPTCDPVLQARLYRDRDRGKDILALKLNHLAGDGAGGKETLYLVSRLYEELARNPDHRPSANVHGSRDLDQLYTNLSWRQQVAAWRALKRDSWRRVWPPRYIRFATPGADADVSKVKRDYVFRIIAPEQTRALRRFGRAMHATLNDVFMAAYWVAVERVLRPAAGAPPRLRFTVDLRRYLPCRRAEAICNISGFAYLKLRSDGGGDFRSLVRAVRAETAYQKAHGIGLSDWIWLRTVQASQLNPYIDAIFARIVSNPKPQMASMPTLTNIGVVVPDRVRFDGRTACNAFVTASVVFPPLLAPALTGYGDRLTLSVGFCDVPGVRSMAEKLLFETVSALP